MRQLTQTVTMTAENGWAGNCWQTCVSCLLDLDPEVLPSQADCDLRETDADGRPGKFRDSPSYYGRLQAYLRVHHNLTYIEVHGPEELFGLIKVASDQPHLMTGRTPRSDSAGGSRHVVIGQEGRVVWDPHPSHAGLTEDIRWAFLVPFPKAWATTEYPPCVCPACLAAPRNGEAD